MKTVERRLDRLERLAPRSRKQFLIVLTDAAQKFALDSGRCMQILREAGHLDMTSLRCAVDLGYIPNGLDAAELDNINTTYYDYGPQGQQDQVFNKVNLPC